VGLSCELFKESLKALLTSLIGFLDLLHPEFSALDCDNGLLRLAVSESLSISILDVCPVNVLNAYIN